MCSARPMSRRRPLTTGIVALGAARVAGALAAFLVSPVLFGELGAVRFGVYGLVLSFLGYAAVLDLGISSSVTVVVARTWRSGAAAVSRGAIHAGARIYTALAALLLTGVVVLGRPLLGLLNVPPNVVGSGWVLLLAAVVVWWCQRVMAVVAAPLDVDRRYFSSQAVPTALTAAAPVLAMIAVVLGAGLAGVAAALVISAVAALVWMLVVGRDGVVGARQSFDIRAEHQLARDVRLATVADVVNYSTDRIIIAALLGVAPVASYELGLRLASAVLVVASLPQPLVFPALAHIEDDVERRARTNWYASWTTAGTGVLVSILVAVAPAGVELWLGAPDATVAIIAVGLAVAFGIHTTTGVYSAYLKASARFAAARRFALEAAFVNVLATVALAPVYGVEGVVMATVIGLAAPSLRFLGGALRRDDFGWLPIRSVGCAVVAAMAGAVTGRLLLDRVSVDLMQIALASVVAIVTFTLVWLAVGGRRTLG